MSLACGNSWFLSFFFCIRSFSCSVLTFFFLFALNHLSFFCSSSLISETTDDGIIKSFLSSGIRSSEEKPERKKRKRSFFSSSLYTNGKEDQLITFNHITVNFTSAFTYPIICTLLISFFFLTLQQYMLICDRFKGIQSGWEYVNCSITYHQ